MLINAPSIPTDVIVRANQQFPFRKNLIALEAFLTGAAAQYSTFKQLYPTVGAYSVPASKSLVVLAMQVIQGAAPAAAKKMVIQYGDTDVGWSSAAAPTNVASLIPTFNRTTDFCFGTTALTQFIPIEISVFYKIPTGKFLNLAIGSDASQDFGIRLFGYED